MKKLGIISLLIASLAVWGYAGGTVGFDITSTSTCTAPQTGWAYLCGQKNTSGVTSISMSVDGGSYITLPAQGTPGPAGAAGAAGVAGTAATVKVGTVTTGTPASVTDTGTSSAAVLNFVLPQGPAGPAGVTPSLSQFTCTGWTLSGSGISGSNCTFK